MEDKKAKIISRMMDLGCTEDEARVGADAMPDPEKVLQHAQRLREEGREEDAEVVEDTARRIKELIRP